MNSTWLYNVVSMATAKSFVPCIYLYNWCQFLQLPTEVYTLRSETQELKSQIQAVVPNETAGDMNCSSKLCFADSDV